MKHEDIQKLQDLVFKLRQMSDAKVSESLDLAKKEPADLESVKVIGESLGLLAAARTLQRFILEQSQPEDPSKKEAV